MDPCLTPEQIERVAQRDVPDVEWARAHSHMLECATCRAAFQKAYAKRSTANNPSEALPRQGLLPPPITGYEVFELLGEGGFGTVYRAKQQSPSRIVAIKLISIEADQIESYRQRFLHEIKLLAGLEHPNIVRIYDNGVAGDGRMFFAMEYIHGRPANKYIDKLKPALEQTLRLFIAICNGVNHAHRKGVIHRDLKPANILVDDLGVPHILDFGLARAADDSMCTPNVPLGTAMYRPPEQVDNPRNCDVRSDIYTLGVILYQLLTDSYPHPFVDSLSDLHHHICNKPPIPMKRDRHKLDSDIETIVYKALATDPSRRYQSVAEFIRDLERYLAHEPIDAKRDSVLYILSKRLRRHRLQVAAGVLLAAALTVIGMAVSSRAASLRMAARLEARQLLNDARLIPVHSEAEARQMLMRAMALDPTLRADAELELALMARRAGNLDESEALLERHVRDHPTRPEAHALLAITRAHDAAKAKHHMAEARRLGLTDESLALYRAMLDDGTSAPESIVALDSTMASMPANFHYVAERARLRFASGDFQGAVTDARALCTGAPKSAAARNLLGSAYAGMEKWKEACEQFSVAINLDPSIWTTHYNRALANIWLGQDAASEADCVAVLQRYQNHPDTLLLQVWLACRARDWGRAFRFCDAVVQLKPDVEPSLKILRHIADQPYLDQNVKQRQDIVLRLNDWLLAHMQDPAQVVLLNLSSSELLLRLGRNVDALAAAQAAARFMPDHDAVRVSCAAARLALGDYDGVLHELDERHPAIVISQHAAVYRGTAAYCRDDLKSATIDWLVARDVNGVPLTEACTGFWIWEAAARSDDCETAVHVMADTESGIMDGLAVAMSDANSSSADAYGRYRATASMLRGTIDSATVLPLSVDPIALCETNYYSGVQAMMSGDLQSAGEQFVESILVGAPASMEWSMAIAHLARIGMPWPDAPPATTDPTMSTAFGAQ